MKKAFLLSLILLVFWGGTAFAQQLPSVYPMTYWVFGTVATDEADPNCPDPAGYTVVLYGVSQESGVEGYILEAYAEGTVESNGTFLINAFDDLRLNPQVGVNYYLAVYNEKDYGVDQMTIQFTGQGYTEIVDPLVLTFGQGPAPFFPATVEVTEGAVILNISREADKSIKVSWQLNPEYIADGRLTGTELVDIYYLSGTGAGDYSNTAIAAGDLIIQASVLAAGAHTAAALVAGENAFTWTGQVGGGDPELYFKGCITAQENDVELGLAKAAAVGKLNIVLSGEASTQGKNLISIPFVPLPGPTVAEVFEEGSGTIWKEGDMVLSKISGSPAYLTAIYTKDQWRDAAAPADPPNFNIDCRFGNWIVITSNKMLTVVGKIVNVDTAVAIYDGKGLPSGGKTLLGMVYPVQLGLTATSLIDDGALEGDIVLYKVSALAPQYVSAVVVGGAWKNAADTSQALDPKIATLKLPYSYTYSRYGDLGFTWRRKKP